jgi:hypothetical protein
LPPSFANHGAPAFWVSTNPMALAVVVSSLLNKWA